MNEWCRSGAWDLLATQHSVNSVIMMHGLTLSARNIHILHTQCVRGNMQGGRETPTIHDTHSLIGVGKGDGDGAE